MGCLYWGDNVLMGQALADASDIQAFESIVRRTLLWKTALEQPACGEASE